MPVLISPGAEIFSKFREENSKEKTILEKYINLKMNLFEIIPVS
jgi:hypothetical protein